MARVVNALSVDVEEYYHAMIFQEATRGWDHAGWPSRVEASIARILDLLQHRHVHATFFVLGEVAASHPAMVRKIAGDGHEIGCHSFRHENVSRQSPHAFRADVRKAKALLEDISGQRVDGYRAPNFSIGRSQRWAWEVLLEEGYRYDSSVYPVHHDRYGDPEAPRFPYEAHRNGTTCLLEFPIGTLRLRAMNLPIGGGGYFRLLPVAFAQSAIRRVNAREGQPLMFYFHPWELDPGQPRAPMRWPHRFRHRIGLGSEEAKLDRLFRGVPFDTARSVLGLGGPAGVCTPS
ncbi:MAG: XrtA system polysaccharide deacetylase [Thermoanaerobaculia bacterium]